MSKLDSEVEEQVARLAERVDELEDELGDVREENHRLREANERQAEQIEYLEQGLLGEWGCGMLEVELDAESLADAVVELSDEMDVAKNAVSKSDLERKVGLLRSEHGAKIKQLADETGTDLGISDGDLITRVRHEGIDAVHGGHVYDRHRRAEAVLKNLEQWGEKKNIGYSAVRLSRPDVRKYLNASEYVDGELTSKTVGEILTYIEEELAVPSSRRSSRRKEGRSDVLYLEVSEVSE